MTARPEFSVDRPFVVAVAGGVTFNGRRYRAGESFPWKQLGITEAGIWELWLMFQVDNVAAPAVASCPGSSAGPVARASLQADAPARPSSTDSAPSVASTQPRTASAKPASAPPLPAPPRDSVKPAKSSKPQQLNPLLVKR